jgi:serine/threonine-protein kinase
VINALPETGSVIENRYTLVRPLGQGGFSRVFLASDQETGSLVVLKFPDLAQIGDPAVYERFRREMAIAKLLDHPDLPGAVAMSEGNPPFLVLKYVAGESLVRVMAERGRFPVAETVAMVAGLLEALDYCHQRGVYHRDLKPENLLVSPDGRLKIIDFGIAMLEGGPRVTWRGFSGLMGTPEYMAPEQIKGERGGARTDIYAAGCLTYHLLAGRPPFTGDNPLAVMHQHLTSEPEALTTVRRDVPPGLWSCLRRATRRRKEERYATAGEMAADLRSPEQVDLKWIREGDPPLVSVLRDQKAPVLWIYGAVTAGLVLALLVILLTFRR